MTDRNGQPQQQHSPFAPAWPEGVLMRYLTVGGATVDLRKTRFTTRWNGGPPFAATEAREIDGFQWTCTGCQSYGREGDTYNDPHFRELKEAREDAQAHAERCRALPRPAASQ
ncbi:hypothetical protein [Streptomyces sp. ZSW22]|uniref:hypothetical protein n=1 Tax=Streptomyces sp. ZSW22 TaxID=3055050 RepID=UPI0025B00C92|nr:hypothetical protein [Streptomyces sp. ZSW22]MDN3244133.1 hypothetical protein [Streptomyces sp. ZSW22]